MPSAPAELAWILTLLSETAPYAVPALAELEESLLPGVGGLRERVLDESRRLWNDDLAGCLELPALAHHAGCLLDPDLDRLLGWLAHTTNHPGPHYELLSERTEVREAVGARFERLCRDGSVRARYRELIRPVWEVVRGAWRRDGRRVSAEACETWRTRVAAAGHIEDLVAPRHPLAQAEHHGLEDLWTHRAGFVLSPLYFCLSGGHVADVGEYVHVAVPASDLLPVRKVRDALFVADRLRVLAEATRVHILIQLLSAPAAVMELARTLRLSQATVSGHVKVLRNAGLVQHRRVGSRTVLVASRKRVERLLEDVRSTISRWD